MCTGGRASRDQEGERERERERERWWKEPEEGGGEGGEGREDIEMSEARGAAFGELPLTAECSVCGGPAHHHLHYGAVCCYSCRYSACACTFVQYCQIEFSVAFSTFMLIHCGANRQTALHC